MLVFLAGLVVAQSVGRAVGSSPTRSLVLYIWHTVFCLVYAVYVLTNGGDAVAYYAAGLQSGAEFSVGTDAITFLVNILVSTLGLSFLGASLVFNVPGVIGLLAFDASLRVATADKTGAIRRLGTLIIFLPSVSFWSSAIGKDSISFMSCGLALWAALDLKRRSWLMAAAVASMTLVRPHIAGLMVAALTLSILTATKTAPARRVLLSGVALAASIFLVPFGLNYSGLGTDSGVQDIMAFAEKRQGYNQEGGGGIDISGMSPLMQLFTYLFRPLPFEARNLFGFIASIDNVIMLLLFLLCGRRTLKRGQKILDENRTFMWAYSLLAWIILATTTANMGISLRQKWMFSPMLIFLLISVLATKCTTRPHLPQRVGTKQPKRWRSQ